MVNPLIALQGNPVDWADRYSKGRADGQAFQLNAFNMDNVREDRQIAAQDRSRKDIADSQAMVGNVLMAIKKQPPEMRAQALERGKQIIGSRFPGVDLSTFTVESIDSDLAALTDYGARFKIEQEEKLAPYAVPMAQAELTGRTLTNEGLALGNDGKRRTNAYWDNGGVFGGGATTGGTYMSRLGGKESGGDPTARNPNSTATGTYQFIDDTWNRIAATPEGQQAGLTLDGRTDPRQQEVAAGILTRQNAAALEAANIPVTEKTAYLAHFLGAPMAVKMLTSSPAASAADVAPEAARSNRSVFYRPDGTPKSVEEFVVEHTKQFPNTPLSAGGAAAPQGQPQPGPQTQMQPSPTAPAGGSAIERAMADPRIQELQRRVTMASMAGDTAGAQAAQKYVDALMAEYGVGVTQPAAPPGYRWTADGNQEPIPGGPATQPSATDRKAERDLVVANQKAEIAARQQVDTANAIVATTDKVLADMGTWSTGFLGAVAGAIPGSNAYNVQRNVDTIKANLGFQALDAMRAASPTGGALGSITERELAMLQATVASLDTWQTYSQLQANLLKVKQHLNNWKNAVEESRKGSPQPQPYTASPGQPGFDPVASANAPRAAPSPAAPAGGAPVRRRYDAEGNLIP